LAPGRQSGPDGTGPFAGHRREEHPHGARSSGKSKEEWIRLNPCPGATEWKRGSVWRLSDNGESRNCVRNECGGKEARGRIADEQGSMAPEVPQETVAGAGCRMDASEEGRAKRRPSGYSERRFWMTSIKQDFHDCNRGVIPIVVWE
jgi:hypothetical protein